MVQWCVGIGRFYCTCINKIVLSFNMLNSIDLFQCDFQPFQFEIHGSINYYEFTFMDLILKAL